MNQLTIIKDHLTKYGSITSWDSIMQYRCTRLSEYIRQLREDGFQIESEWQHNDEKRWVKYILVAFPEKNGQMCLA